jgi:hydrogenase maturation protein HypF
MPPPATHQNLSPNQSDRGYLDATTAPKTIRYCLLAYCCHQPLLATSANIPGEPIISNNTDASKRLLKLCDGFLHNNRPIVRPTDDPVMQNNSSTQILRSGRGLAPTEFTLPFTLEKPLLAVGGHIKNTIALAWENRMVISAPNGDLRSYQIFQQTIHDLQQLYQVKAEHIICDAHLGYGSSHWADAADLAVCRIYHHHAHASSLVLEYPQQNHWLIFTWDGVGLGDDGSLWGGETFFGSPGNWQRVASFKSFKLPGGDKSSREAWRRLQMNVTSKLFVVTLKLSHADRAVRFISPQQVLVTRHRLLITVRP